MIFPSPWVALVLAAASFRIWRLIAVDTILERPRRHIARLPQNWVEGQPIPKNYRGGLAEFLLCPWCCGFWISLAIWGAWEIEPHWIEILMMPFAISAAVGLIRTNLDPPE